MRGSEILESLKRPRPSVHPVDIGLRTEAAVLAYLLRRGVRVLQPCGFNHRYDLVLELEGTFVRAQIKTGRLRNGAIEFKTCSIRSNSQKAILRDYGNEIDLFLVCCPAEEEIYAVPVSQAPKGMMRLRTTATANSQAAGIRRASEFVLPA